MDSGFTVTDREEIKKIVEGKKLLEINWQDFREGKTEHFQLVFEGGIAMGMFPIIDSMQGGIRFKQILIV